IVTDPNVGTTSYYVLRNGTVIETGIWISSIPIIIDVDGLAVGCYLYTINASDGLGASVQDDVLLNVVLTNLPPVISTPDDVSYSHGTTGHMISWTITDSTTNNPTCLITNNASFSVNVSWSNGVPVSINIDGLAVGSYLYSINVNDGFGSFIQDTVLVIVLNVAPSITHPADIVYTFGETGNFISWNIIDLSTGATSYVIERNNVSVFSGSWASDVPFGYSVDDLANGLYSIAIIATDGFGGLAIDVVLVTVLTAVPSITTPANISYNHGETGNFISWTISDCDIGTTSYTIKRDGTVVDTGTWTNNTPVSISVDGLPVGTYLFSINASDGLGGNVQGQVFVTVYNIAPVISSPADVVFKSDVPVMSVSWIATDASVSGATYALYRNGTGILFGTWTSGSPIDVNIAFLAPGTYNLTMVVNDGYGGTAGDWIIARIVLQLFPSAVFSANATTIRPGDSITFVYHGLAGNGPTTYMWNFGDGSANVTTENATHVFNTEGIFIVVLVITDSDGDAASFSMTITVSKGNPMESDSLLEYLATPEFLAIVLVVSIGLTIMGLALHAAHKTNVKLAQKKLKESPASKQTSKTLRSDAAFDRGSSPKVPKGYTADTTTRSKALPLIQASQVLQSQEAQFEELRKELVAVETLFKDGKLTKEEYDQRNARVRNLLFDLASTIKK
ncbi:MAG: PKD domain-containing protein, partial [Candidatus Sigynarchaeum springense]